MKTQKQIKGDLIQQLGILFLIVGITVELICGGSIWHTIITLGAVVFALGTKIKHGGI